MLARRLVAVLTAVGLSFLGLAATPALAAPASAPTATTVTPTAVPASMYAFLEAWILDIGGFWSTVPGVTPFAYYYFPVPGESVQPACAGGPTTDDSMLYCPGDDTVYFSQSVATRVWNGTYEIYPGQYAAGPAGDAGVIYLLAHEYAHNVQSEVGLYGDPLTNADDPYPLINMELHADCWSGVFLRAKLDAGQLEAGDPEEAVWAAARVGDYAYTDPQHHGTPDQRVWAFDVGYTSGQPIACDQVLFTRF